MCLLTHTWCSISCCPSCLPFLYILHIFRAQHNQCDCAFYYRLTRLQPLPMKWALLLFSLYTRKLRKEGEVTVVRSAPSPPGHSCPQHEPLLHRLTLPPCPQWCPALGNTSSVSSFLLYNQNLCSCLTEHPQDMGWDSPFHASPEQMWINGSCSKAHQTVWCSWHSPSLASCLLWRGTSLPQKPFFKGLSCQALDS